MRKLILALSAGAFVSVALLLLGVDQPGRWVAAVAGLPVPGYDIFMHDLYLIVRPAVLLINSVVFGLVALAIMMLGSSVASGRGEGAGA
jgi:hypothetical protein